MADTDPRSDDTLAKALEELIAQAMSTGYVTVLHQYADLQRLVLVDEMAPSDAVRTLLGAEPRDLLITRGSLVDAVLAAAGAQALRDAAELLAGGQGADAWLRHLDTLRSAQEVTDD